MTRPFEIAVISGKGGTGKTVLTSSLAALIDDKVIADCDVDAPDLHLLLKPSIVRQGDFPGPKLATIDQNACTGCGRCLEVCRFGAVSIEQPGAAKRYRISSLVCEGCTVCTWLCPTEAIGLEDGPAGKWFVSDTRFGKLVHARLGIAQENSGKLVTIVRREARDVAIASECGCVLIDGPPGIGCPVIASVAGTDFVVIVTEPTLSGIHDLERTLWLAEHFGLDAGVVINKYDLNRDVTSDIERLLNERRIRDLGIIPFGNEVNRAIAAGKAVVEVPDSEVAERIRTVAGRIVEVLHEKQDGKAGSMR
jgi:MinD superfamily P-loop ATPase